MWAGDGQYRCLSVHALCLTSAVSPVFSLNSIYSCSLRCQQLETGCLKPEAGEVHIVSLYVYICTCIYIYIFFTNSLSSWSAREGNRIRPLVLFVSESTVFSVCVDLCCWLLAYVCSVCECVHIRTCAYWEYVLSLIMGWTWWHGTMAASPPFCYQIWQLLTDPTHIPWEY